MNQTINIAIVGAILILAVLLLFIGVLLVLTLRTQKKRNRYALEWERQRMDEEQFQAYQGQYAFLQDQHHDMKHHIRYIRELIDRKEYDALKNYIDSVIQFIS